MDIFKGAEKLMAMDDAVWARHANPWSGYTRIAAAVPIFFSLYSVHWVGWWSLLAIGVCVLWIFINPRLWPAPDKVDAWISQGVLGERVWLNRKNIDVPEHHKPIVHITTAASAAFVFLSIYGFLTADFWLAFTAWFAAVGAKCWFIDRMVWIWREMWQAHRVYEAWAQADWSAKVADAR